MNKLLTVRDLTDMLQVSYPTLYRWLNAGSFPAPLTGRGRKLLWTQSAIEEWMCRPSTLIENTTPSTATEQRRERKAYEQRQEAAKATLARHGITKKEGGAV